MQVAFDGWLKEVAGKSEHPFVRDCEQMIAYCDRLATSLPEKYGWRFLDVEAFKQRAHRIEETRDINRSFWIDQARTAEAYAVMSFWRSTELIENAVLTLNRQDLVSAAVLARSSIELAATFAVNANKIGNFLSELTFPPDAIVVSQDFEELVVKAIWGTRLGDPEPLYRQPNVLNVIQKLSKRPEAAELQPTYDYLCELAHPNAIGNLRFWADVEKVNEDGSELRTLRRRHTSNLTPTIVHHVLWSLGWSSVTVTNAFKISQTGVGRLLSKLRNGVGPAN